MTAKDFNAIAGAIKAAREVTAPANPELLSVSPDYDGGYEDGHAMTLDQVVSHLARVLADSNPRFDRDRFYAACK